MELRHLRYLDAVVRCGGFTRAAEQLHVAQSAVSAQIRQLEAGLGVTLLARTTRRVSLTAAGEVFLVRARRVLAELDAARGDLDDLGAVLRGRVSVGATPVVGRLDLPAVLAGFHRRYPGVGLALRTGLIADLLDALDTGDVDLIVGPLHADLPARYVAHRLDEEHMVLVVPPDHRLAAQAEPVSAEPAAVGAVRPGAAPAVAGLADVREEAFVCLPAGSGLRAILLAAAAGAEFEPRVPFETDTPSGIRALVSAGLGVALLARSTARAAGPPVAVLDLHPAISHPPIAVIHRRDRGLPPAAVALHRRLRV